jgi:hypothetical protein
MGFLNVFLWLYFRGAQESEPESQYSREGQPRGATVISLQKPVGGHEYAITGENYDPLMERDIDHPTSYASI